MNKWMFDVSRIEAVFLFKSQLFKMSLFFYLRFCVTWTLFYELVFYYNKYLPKSNLKHFLQAEESYSRSFVIMLKCYLLVVI